MGRKIFISYKYGDTDVKNIGNAWEICKVRDYVTKIEEELGDKEHIYKGESDGEDLSHLSEDAIWDKLKDRIYDSSLTIIMISKNMKDLFKLEKNQWIAREISYSLKEMKRKNKNGDSVTSKENALLAIVVPDRYDSYEYFLEDKKCCSKGCRLNKTNELFQIIRDNMFNIKKPNSTICDTGSTIYYENPSYITVVKWCDFIEDMDKYIDKSYDIREKIEDYNICKEVK